MHVEIDVELLLDKLGADYRRTTGRSGTQINVRECPRCGGNKWKVYLNADSGLGNCFHGSCVDEPGFNPFTFAKFTLKSQDAASKLVGESSKGDQWRPMTRRKLHQTRAMDWKLPESLPLPFKGKDLPYLAKRGFVADTTTHYGWRFSERGEFGYMSHNGKMAYQDYSRRVIIPVYNLDGKLVTFQGRDITGEKEKKYLFPPNLTGTSAYLYDGNNAIGKEHVILNEGAMDVAATRLALLSGDDMDHIHAVGTFGKNLSMGEGESQLNQLLLLKASGLKRITFMWDGETNTTKTAIKQAMALSRYGFSVYVAMLPEGKDPNEVEPEAVRLALVRAKGGSVTALHRLNIALSRAA